MAEKSADSQEVGGSRNPELNIFCAETTIADLSTRQALNSCFIFCPSPLSEGRRPSRIFNGPSAWRRRFSRQR